MSKSTPSTGDRFLSSTLMVLTLALIVIALLLARQNHALKARVADLQQEAIESRPSLKAGEIVAPLSLPSLDGELVEVSYEPGQPETLLLFFSPGCPACMENMDN